MNGHEMHVERLLAYRGNGLEHRKTKRDVGYEYTIHHIQVKPVGITGVDHLYLMAQVGEVGGQQRGGNQYRHLVP